MADEVFFNGRAFRRVLGEPEVKFLEALYNRSGGARAPDVNLTEINNIVSVMAESQVNLTAQLKRLERRINELENAL